MVAPPPIGIKAARLLKQRQKIAKRHRGLIDVFLEDPNRQTSEGR